MGDVDGWNQVHVVRKGNKRMYRGNSGEWKNKRMISVRRGGTLFLIHLDKTDDNSTLKEILARK